MCYEAIRARNRGKPKPKKNNHKIIKRNAMGWVEREEKPTRLIDDSELAKMIILDRAVDSGVLTDSISSDGFRVSETDNHPFDAENERPDSKDGIRVTDPNNQLNDSDSPKTITEDGNRVSETVNTPNDTDRRIPDEKLDRIDGIRVSETKPQSIICDTETITEDGNRVTGTRLAELEHVLGATNESLAYALRRIRVLEEKLEKLSPVIEKEEAKRDAAGLQKLRDDLYKLLRERMEKNHTNGIYVHSLYGKNGRRGGKLNISKMQAFRLRDACRGDDRFRVEKADNQRGNWAILLNIHMN